MKEPVRIAVTGAAGQICYSLLFTIASGDMLGKDQPVILQLLDIPEAQDKVKGVMMELKDAAFPLLTDMFTTDDPEKAFKDVKIALLVGSQPRKDGQSRADLLEANSKIFQVQGAALNKVANRDVKVLVVGNPANTNAYVAMKSAPDLPARNFTAMLRLDHNRSLAQLADKLKVNVKDIHKMVVWGNHSSTMYADFRFATVDGKNVKEVISDQEWYVDTFLPTVANRGGAIIKARGLSSAASAAQAAVQHMRSWILGSEGEWVTMGVLSDGSYPEIPEGLIFGQPTICENGDYKIVKGLEFDDFSKEKIKETVEDLESERERAASSLG